jgi:Reverse transcriptase (RNA-dependent DNA polymerase)
MWLPHGSVLGTLLFLIYMNYIVNVLGISTVELFADDTNIFIAEENLSETNVVANSRLQLMYSWFTSNYLSLNIDKTCYMVYPPDKHESTAININGCIINKFLAVDIWV